MVEVGGGADDEGTAGDGEEAGARLLVGERRCCTPKSLRETPPVEIRDDGGLVIGSNGIFFGLQSWFFEEVIHEDDEFAHDGGESDFGGFLCGGLIRRLL